MKNLLITGLFWLFLIPVAFAQHQITGKVTDEHSGDPLPGVNIRAEGGGQTAMTDYNGAYTISVPKSTNLLFSFIGYKTKKISTENLATLNVALSSESESLQEIVVTGYTKVKKPT